MEKIEVVVNGKKLVKIKETVGHGAHIPFKKFTKVKFDGTKTDIINLSLIAGKEEFESKPVYELTVSFTLDE